MKAEPNIGDTVWIYIYGKLYECTVTQHEPTVDSIMGTDRGKCYQITPKNDVIAGHPQGILMQSKFFFATPREAINDEIARTSKMIKSKKIAFEHHRDEIRQLKHKRADLQRMLEHYPKQP